MKAITLWQPWASLIADGRKPEETRPRPWAHVGPVAIHAGIKVDVAAARQFGYDPYLLPRGAVVCVVNKTGCVQFPNAATPPNPYGNFTPGRYGYTFDKNIWKLQTPLAAKGMQGMWEWSPKYFFFWLNGERWLWQADQKPVRLLDIAPHAENRATMEHCYALLGLR